MQKMAFQVTISWGFQVVKWIEVEEITVKQNFNMFQLLHKFYRVMMWLQDVMMYVTGCFYKP